MTTANVLKKLSMATAGAVIASTVMNITPAHAADFTFSFSNTTGQTAGTVTGIVRGLKDGTNNLDSTVTAEVFSATSPAPLGIYTLDPSFANTNSYTVSNGQVTAFNEAFNQGGYPGFELLLTNSFSGIYNGLSYFPQLMNIDVPKGIFGTTYNLRDQSTGAGVNFKPVPEPASLMGILGLGAFGVTSLRKRRQVSAVKA